MFCIECVRVQPVADPPAFARYLSCPFVLAHRHPRLYKASCSRSCTGTAASSLPMSDLLASPSKRTRADDDDDGRLHEPNGRHSKHISRACDVCRDRCASCAYACALYRLMTVGSKYRCDGVKPECAQCAQRRDEVRLSLLPPHALWLIRCYVQCIYTQKVDRRRALNKEQVAALNDRIAALEVANRQSDVQNRLLKEENALLKAMLREHDVPWHYPALMLTIPDAAPSSPYLSAASSDGSASPFWPSPQSAATSLPSPAIVNADLLSATWNMTANMTAHGRSRSISSASSGTDDSMLFDVDLDVPLTLHLPVPTFSDGGVEAMTLMLHDTALASPLLPPDFPFDAGHLPIDAPLSFAGASVPFADPSYGAVDPDTSGRVFAHSFEPLFEPQV